MNGVNLIDFTMPTAVPASAGGKAGITLPKKEREQTEKGKREQTKKADWWKALLPLLGIVFVIKLATWLGRRKR
ncbi:hypothetical protein [Thermococcus sp.]|uniref:hypothetical protein n=1 Tax=Thermococcus sp. TaxID=35749 RepID=UPI0025DC62B3|nr:hypothetical protein [Thermococcus sp.]